MKPLLLVFLPFFGLAQTSHLTSTVYSEYRNGTWSEVKDTMTTVHLVGDSLVTYGPHRMKIYSTYAEKSKFVFNCVEAGVPCTVVCGYKKRIKYITLCWPVEKHYIHLTGFVGR